MTTQKSNRNIEQWDSCELSFSGPAIGNPYTDVQLSAIFSNEDQNITVDGFYDGKGTYKIRFMPGKTGKWKYRTSSNSKELSDITGVFNCTPASGNNHGPVKIQNRYQFAYSDDKPFHPFGTTAYAWIHQGNTLETATLKTLADSPFNKLRMCVFPKSYNYNHNEPEFYPFELISKTESPEGKEQFEWDFTKFNPGFFSHLEERIKDLMKLGIEADIIIYHPYDKGHWGFDLMSYETDIFYLKYLIARLSSFRNIWWSLANEYDFMTVGHDEISIKTREHWDSFIATIDTHDPYKHLCSIHNGNVDYYDVWDPRLTHASVQNTSLVEDFGRANTLLEAYKKPLIYDEVGYEGNFPERWGNLSPEEMVHRFWQGIIAGTYVTHGETYLADDKVVWWARGGVLHGTSPARIAFLRKIVEETGYMTLVDKWKDLHTTGTEDLDTFIIYFGREVKKEWLFSIPAKPGFPLQAEVKFKAEIIDTWNMTITPVEDTFVTGEKEGYRIFDKNKKAIALPEKQYLAIRFRKVTG